jgi:crotonobetainyl-CoA:carnitine CoA-transferase CaiB-like acyl-CoA transferase
MELPLASLRVLDLTEGDAQYCGRYLADLGAQVILAEPPGGSAGRRDPAVFGLRNANKSSVILDWADFGRLARAADILLGSFTSQEAERLRLTQDYPGLVVVSVTAFGRPGPYRDFAATEPVLAALGGVLSRSGQPGARPLPPPPGLIGQTAAVHAAWAALVGYAGRLRTGRGEHADVSALEAVVHGFDPGFGTQGTAAAAQPETFPRDRPDAADYYPVFRCADGHVRICVLARRQWRAMFAWLGSPAEFADPRYDEIPARYAAAGRLHPLIAALLADRGREELVAEGARRGVPVAGLLTPAEVLTAPHFAESGTLIDAEVAEGVRARIPSGYVRIDGVRAGWRRPAPRPGEHDPDVFGPRPAPPALDLGGQPEIGPDEGPLAGLRVLDLGVIVFGAELGRLLADQGADVIKVENSAFPDGLRQTLRGAGMNASFAWGNRNRRGLGLDLRSEHGRRLFLDLVRQADVVLANFKPGTLASLGLSYAELARVNPRIIVSDSSAFGSTGTWSGRLGYGPLVRASCGISELWRDPDGAYCDGVTVYPDHVAGHVAAIAVLAAVIGRARTGRGAALEVAQADVAVMHLGPVLAAGASAEPGRTAAVFRCAGDDEWCVIDIRDGEDQARLAYLAGRPDLAATGDRSVLDRAVAAWAAALGPDEAMAAAQAAGVPAGSMRRLPDLLADPHLAARQSFGTMSHPLLSRPVPANARAARFSVIGDPPQRPAPVPGEHTREIGRTLLGLSSDDIDHLVSEGVLEESILNHQSPKEARHDRTRH